MSERELEVIDRKCTRARPTLLARFGREDGDQCRMTKSNQAEPAGLCHHVMESGFYCQSPALHHRRYCYSHLRLRGECLRMARAIARRQPYRFFLPALDDLYAVQAAVEHVARALGAGLLERRQAGTLLYALQQSAINHRILALARMNPQDGRYTPPFPPTSGEKGEDGAAPADRAGGRNVWWTSIPNSRLSSDYRWGWTCRSRRTWFSLLPEEVWRPSSRPDPKATALDPHHPSTRWTKERLSWRNWKSAGSKWTGSVKSAG